MPCASRSLIARSRHESGVTQYRLVRLSWNQWVELNGYGWHRGPMKALKGRRILIAEDESLIALEMEGVLEELGCEVVGPVSRVEDVRGHIETSSLDGALLDVNLRGQQIFGLLSHLIERRIPLIITSGYDDPTLLPESFRTVPRIAKPFAAAALGRLCIAIFARV